MIREAGVSGALKSLTGQRQFETRSILTTRKTCCLSGNLRTISSSQVLNSENRPKIDISVETWTDCHRRNKVKKTVLLLVGTFLLSGCSDYSSGKNSTYLDYSGRDDVFTGGMKMIPVDTPKGTFQVWTKRVGNNPTMKVLLLHGGPGATHEAFVAFDSYFPAAEIEYYYYDQLGSFYSDQPDEPELWEIPRFVEEVEQVRQSLGLDRDNFYLYGQSWGGILAIEYALKYQQHIKEWLSRT